MISDSVTNINDFAFDYCTALTNVKFGNFVEIIGKEAFSGCSKLTGITLPDSLEVIDSSAFYMCSGIKELTIPDSVKRIGDSAFAHCKYLTTVTISDSVEYIGSSAFAYCSYLQEFTIPSQVTSINDNTFKSCTNLTNVTIPNSVTGVGEWAFNGCTKLSSIIIPDSVVSIGTLAFRMCSSLESITIPATVTSIGANAFQYCPVTVTCPVNSYAHTYSVENSIPYVLICDHIFTNYIDDNNTTCTDDGTKTAYCDNGCGVVDTVILEGSAQGHSWTEWMITVEPTYTTDGEKIRLCTVCKTSEGEIIPKLPVPETPDIPVIMVNNFTVTISNADDIKDIRYAPGEHSTTTEIRNAEGNVALSSEIVVNNTVDGNFVYTIPQGGIYSIWIRMKDGTNHILPLDTTNVTASVSAYGVKITVHDLYDVKDFFIAKGTHGSYNEIKTNGYIVRITSSKIGTKCNYTYTVFEPGMHTVLVRYNDGRELIFHEELVVTEPVFDTNGLQVTVSNMDDVKVIRTAYGEYNTPGEVKKSPGARNFSNKSVIKNADSYTIQYRESGIVTVVVEYNNGYVAVFHYSVQKKQAECIQSMSTVLFDNTDGFVMIRYAMGEYTTSAQIKRASGSKVIKPADVTGPYAMVSGLEAGTYTFCVQFDDESYNYFVVNIK